MPPGSLSRGLERAPYRSVHVLAGLALGQALVHLPVHRDFLQDALATVIRFEDDHAAVGREAGRLVQLAVGDGLQRAAGQVHHGDVQVAVFPVHEGQRLAIGRYPRIRVVAAVEGDTLGFAALGAHLVYLRRAAPVGGEVQAPTVRRPDRLRVDGIRSGDAT